MSPADMITMANMMANLFFYNLVVMLAINLVLSCILGIAAKHRGRPSWKWMLFGVLFSSPIGVLFLIAFGDSEEKDAARLEQLADMLREK